MHHGHDDGLCRFEVLAIYITNHRTLQLIGEWPLAHDIPTLDGDILIPAFQNIHNQLRLFEEEVDGKIVSSCRWLIMSKISIQNKRLTKAPASPS
jgi:hypothetical protein